MDNRRLLLAVLLSLGVVLVWNAIFPPQPPVRPPVEAPVEESVAGDEGRGETSGIAGGAPTGAESQPAILGEAQPPPAQPEAIAAQREIRTTIETASALIELTNRGGQLLSYQLKDQVSGEGEPLDLVRARAAGPYPFGLGNDRGIPLDLNEVLFEVDERSDGRGVTYRYRGPAGEAIKEFRFEEDGQFEVSVELPGQEDWQLLVGPGLQNPPEAEMESRYSRRSLVYRAGGDFERTDERKFEVETRLPVTGLSWLGLEDTYFLTAVQPQEPLREVVIKPVRVEVGEEGQPGVLRPVGEASGEVGKKDKIALAIWLQPSRDSLTAWNFWGAKRYGELQSFGRGLEETVDLGFFAFLARPMMLALAWIHDNVVSNYGWAIVIMTILIRLLLLPLTHRSIVSMRKMQKLNPKMQAIRQKYASKKRDKQGRPNMEAQRKMNEEVMALYKAEGVNPASGCFPILLQLPIFFAFFKILYSWVELRNAPWALWIQDLSAADPYLVLPIVMGASQFIQQWMTPMAGNPMQRRIMLMMPIFFTFLFLSFPSGLVLYWLTNNVFGIAQQAVYNRVRDQQEEREAEEAAEAKKTRKKNKKKVTSEK